MSYLIIIETDDEGVVRLAKLNAKNQSTFAKALKDFFILDGELVSFSDEDEPFDFESSSDQEVLSFFKEKIESSFVDGDSFSRYQLFDEELVEREIGI